jgi:lactoylglutathione lyase
MALSHERSKNSVERKENQMIITAVDHITINCFKLQESFDFYEKVLGLSRINTFDMGDHVLHYYQLPGVKLELIEYKNEQTHVITGNTNVGIYRHLALRVDDIEEAYRRCQQAGCRINLKPTAIKLLNDRIIMLIVDPNGVEIEMIQQQD